MKHLNVTAVGGKLSVSDPEGADFSWVEFVGLSNTPAGSMLVLGTSQFNFALDLGKAAQPPTPTPTPTTS
jgi:hypothetical protein